MKYLTENNISILAVDADSTIVTHNSDIVQKETSRILKKSPLPVYLVTNRSFPKAQRIGALIGAQHIVYATRTLRKPRTEYFREAFAKSGVGAHNICIVGDRLLTDIVGGNASGLVTIHVKNLGKDAWYMRWTGFRILENWLVRILTKGFIKVT